MSSPVQPGQQFYHAGKGSPAGVNRVANGGRSSGTSSPAPKRETLSPPPPRPKKLTVAPETRSAKEDSVDTAITGVSRRDGCVQLRSLAPFANIIATKDAGAGLKNATGNGRSKSSETV